MAGNSTVLDIKDVSVCFDGFYALTEVNAAVKRHSIHFFIGPNGAGKTTLLDIICGKTKPTAGSVIFHPESRADVRLTGMPEYKIVREGVGRKFQVPSVFGSLTVWDNMMLSLKGHDMDFVRQAADIVTVLHEGKVLTEGTVDEVLADATVQAVYLGRGKAAS